MLYVLLLIFGFIGLFIMAIMGSLRVGGHRGAGRGLHRGHAPAVGRGYQAQAHGARGHAAQSHAVRGPSRMARNMSWLLQGLSPIDLFAMAMGAGALGIIGNKVFHDRTIAACLAIAGAVVMDLAIVRPIFSMLLRFASTPSSGLEGTISQLAEATGPFDEKGRGLIKLTLDGQTSQILANLEQGELAAGIHVKKGDSLVVLEVDPTRNICRVSREIASEFPPLP